MELLVIRHGVAIERSPDATDADDAARALTPRGRRRMKKVARGLVRADLAVEHVLHSPKLRAIETAELIDAPRSVSDFLTGPPRAELFAELAALGVARAAVVGHEPWLGALIATLVAGDARLSDALVLKKGGVAWLDGTPTPGGMHLRALLPPKILRAI